MRVAALVTGGKDSALALHRAVKQGHEIVSLITMVPERADSWMFHYPNIHMADMFAEAAGIPLVKAETSGVKEAELVDLKQALAQLPIEAAVTGAISSQYQKERVDRICAELGLNHIVPLWQNDPLSLLNEMRELKMKVIIVGVYAHGLTSDWLGREIDETTVSDLIELNKRYRVSLAGEGGEYETLVLDAPLFKKRIALVKVQKIWEGASGYLQINRAALLDKEE